MAYLGSSVYKEVFFYKATALSMVANYKPNLTREVQLVTTLTADFPIGAQQWYWYSAHVDHSDDQHLILYDMHMMYAPSLEVEVYEMVANANPAAKPTPVRTKA